MKMNKYFLGLAVFLLLFIASCKKDDSTPDNGTDARDKYVKSWTCQETSQQQGNSTYSITISKDVTSSNKILVKNFYALGNTTNTIMIVDGNNITISSQNVTGTILVGSGVYNNSTSMNFTFTADDGITVDNVTISAH